MQCDETNWQGPEANMLKRIQDKLYNDMTPPPYKRCSYDAQTDKYLIEAKVRYGPHYPDTLIENDKLKYNMPKAEEAGKDFVYAVQSGGKIYLFNISQLRRDDYDFGWHKRKCKASTHFGSTIGNHYVDKFVGMIDWNKAYEVLDV